MKEKQERANGNERRKVKANERKVGKSEWK